MSDKETDPPPEAQDGFDRHYAERIWALVPEVYRDADGRADGELRALVEIFARQAAIARRGVDRLWADTSPLDADDWAIPYIGALIGARPVSSRNRAGQRANLGRTIHYRRRQGTARLVETLADDIADWDAVASEAFKRLIRFRFGLDGPPQPGPATGSPQWGYADLRDSRIGGLLDTGFDEFSHYPDFRRHRGRSGRYGIPKLNLHLFRQRAYAVDDSTPRRIEAQHYTFDPSGREIPLFQPGDDDRGECDSAREWEVRAPLSCRRLNAAMFSPDRDAAPDVPAGLADALAPIYGREFRTEAGLIEAANAALADAGMPALSDAQTAYLIENSMQWDAPRRRLLSSEFPITRAVELALARPDPLDDIVFGPADLYGADLSAWPDPAAPGWVRALADPARGRFRLADPPGVDETLELRRYYYGIFHPIGAGTHERSPSASIGAVTASTGQPPAWPDFSAPVNGTFRFTDNRSYAPVLAANGVIEVDDDLLLLAGDQKRPFIELDPPGGILRIRAVTPDISLTLDGIWLSLLGGGNCRIILEGRWSRVVLRDCTLDPGGIRAANAAGVADPIPAVGLVFAGEVGHAVIDRCVTGYVREISNAVNPCSLDTLTVCNSIIDRPNGKAIRLGNSRLRLDRSTVFGDIAAGGLDASESLVDGVIETADAQSGCFRFSAAASGGRVPHPYESHFFAGGLPAGSFVSRRFGDPGYGQLTETASPLIREGGEDATEMGAFHRALDPVKRRDLQAKLDEFTPINVIAQMVFET